MFAGKGPDVMLARQTLLNCGAFHGFGSGCDGGDPIDVCKCPLRASSSVSANILRWLTCIGCRELPSLPCQLSCSPLYGQVQAARRVVHAIQCHRPHQVCRCSSLQKLHPITAKCRIIVVAMMSQRAIKS